MGFITYNISDGTQKINFSSTGPVGNPTDNWIVYGGDGKETITFNDGSNNFEIFYAGDGNYKVTFGDGTDEFHAGTGTYKVTFGNGSDTYYGGVGNDTVTFGSGSGTYYSGQGSDKVTGDGGTDAMYFILSNKGATPSAFSDVYDGGSGTDTLYIDLTSTVLPSGYSSFQSYITAIKNLFNSSSNSDFSTLAHGGLNLLAKNFETLKVIDLQLSAHVAQETGGAGNFTSNPTISGTSLNLTATGSESADGMITILASSFNGTPYTTPIVLGTTNASGGNWSFTPTLADGTYTIVAQEKDKAGVGVSSAPVTLKLDQTPPPLTMALSQDTGASSTDHITSIGTVSGNGDPNRTVGLLIQSNNFSGTQSGSATTDANGHWSYTPTTGDGTYIITAYQTDQAGNFATKSISYNFDTTAPVVHAQIEDTGRSSLDGITNSNVLSGTGALGSIVNVSVDGNPYAQVALGWQMNLLNLADGPHTVLVRETDLAGNVGTKTINFTLDTQPPFLIVNFPDTGSSATDGITNNPILGIVVEEGSFTTVTVDGHAYGPLITDNYFLPLQGLSDGQHTTVVTETDVAGNTTIKTINFTLDTHGPTVTESLSFDSGFNGDLITEVAILTGTGDHNKPVTFTIDGIPIAETTTASNSGQWNFAPVLSPGPHTIVASQVDIAGNVGSASITFTYATIAPNALLIQGADGEGGLYGTTVLNESFWTSTHDVISPTYQAYLSKFIYSGKTPDAFSYSTPVQDGWLYGASLLSPGNGAAGGAGSDAVYPSMEEVVPGPRIFDRNVFESNYFLNGGDGGTGGNGQDINYTLNGGNASNTIIGGNTGNAGWGGLGGTNGNPLDNIVGGVNFGTYTGGVGGIGGNGGNVNYVINAGSGNDTITAGKPGFSGGLPSQPVGHVLSGKSGIVNYTMNGGDGNNTFIVNQLPQTAAEVIQQLHLTEVNSFLHQYSPSTITLDEVVGGPPVTIEVTGGNPPVTHTNIVNTNQYSVPENVTNGGGNLITSMTPSATKEYINGGSGNDLINLQTFYFSATTQYHDIYGTLYINGGGGVNTLEISHNLDALQANTITNIQVIKLDANVNIILDANAVSAIDSSTNSLFIKGDAGSSVTLENAFTEPNPVNTGSTFIQNGITYDVWTLNNNLTTETVFIQHGLQMFFASSTLHLTSSLDGTPVPDIVTPLNDVNGNPLIISGDNPIHGTIDNLVAQFNHIYLDPNVNLTIHGNEIESMSVAHNLYITGGAGSSVTLENVSRDNEVPAINTGEQTVVNGVTYNTWIVNNSDGSNDIVHIQNGITVANTIIVNNLVYNNTNSHPDPVFNALAKNISDITLHDGGAMILSAQDIQPIMNPLGEVFVHGTGSLDLVDIGYSVDGGSMQYSYTLNHLQNPLVHNGISYDTSYTIYLANQGEGTVYVESGTPAPTVTTSNSGPSVVIEGVTIQALSQDLHFTI